MKRLMVLMLILLLSACSQPAEPSLDAFKEQWYAAVNQRKGEALYGLLDAKSRRFMDVQLERVRGLDQDTQRAVINQLGGDRVANLHELSNERFFALFWRKLTDDQPPTMVIEATGGQGAYMMLTLREQSQRIELKVEGGRWVWVLPEQVFEGEIKVTPGTGAPSR
ncbi:MAG: hypothetical protein WD768_16895 [Phycisphaeraceae bacterium]